MYPSAGPAWAPWVSPPVVLGLDRVDVEPAELEGLARGNLPDVPERPQEARSASGNDDRQLAGECLQRRNVEVVVVQVGEQDAMRVFRHRGGTVTAEVEDPTTQDRVGDDPLFVQVDDDGRVTQPGQRGAHARIVALAGCR